MSGRRNRGRSGAIRALLALIAAGACLGSVVAYAAGIRPATKPGGAKAKPGPQKQGDRPPRPNFIEVPASPGVGGDVQFRFHVPPTQTPPSGAAAPDPSPTQPARWRRFQCRLDEGEWGSCSSPYRLPDLEPADHAVAVRALSPRGRPGPAAHYRWTQLAPQEFTVESRVDSLQALMPGDQPQPLPVLIVNPNPVPIEVTSLTVVVTPEAPGCDAGSNFAITPSSVSTGAPLSIPAGGSAELPGAAATAPAISMRELTVDQNACQGAALRLDFAGEARG